MTFVETQITLIWNQICSGILQSRVISRQTDGPAYLESSGLESSIDSLQYKSTAEGESVKIGNGPGFCSVTRLPHFRRVLACDKAMEWSQATRTMALKVLWSFMFSSCVCGGISWLIYINSIHCFPSGVFSVGAHHRNLSRFMCRGRRGQAGPANCVQGWSRKARSAER